MSLLDIHITSPKKLDYMGFSLRREGYEIRDCISIQKDLTSEFALLAKRPTDDGFLRHYLRTSEGMLDIDAARVDSKPRTTHKEGNRPNPHSRKTLIFEGGLKVGYIADVPNKRYPANFILHKGTPVSKMDGQSGILRARGNTTPTKRNQSKGIWGAYGSPFGEGPDGPTDSGDEGGASRFFFQATANQEIADYLQRLIQC